jgi:hypothetical protein
MRSARNPTRPRNGTPPDRAESKGGGVEGEETSVVNYPLTMMDGMFHSCNSVPISIQRTNIRLRFEISYALKQLLSQPL